VGDIHGCYKELMQLFEHIYKNIPEEPVEYVFIGDYIDRGPDSKKVVQFLIDLQRVPMTDSKIICLMGNHEDMMLYEHSMWMANGGRQTQQSYGDDELTKFQHSEWCAKLPLYHVDTRGRVFVHAGIKRSISNMDNQRYNYMLWTREQFFSDMFPDGRYVVHGHTPLSKAYRLPHVLDNRINLDTACVYEGTLSAAFFNKEQTKPYLLVNHLGEKA